MLYVIGRIYRNFESFLRKITCELNKISPKESETIDKIHFLLLAFCVHITI
jgi:hypothetical protein